MTLDPVKTNWPFPLRLSIWNLAAPHSSGIICHSSTRSGTSPSSALEGSRSTIFLYLSYWASSCRWIPEFVTCSAVIVLPHPFGPVMTTPPKRRRSSFRTSSIRRGMYSASVERAMHLETVFRVFVSGYVFMVRFGYILIVRFGSILMVRFGRQPHHPDVWHICVDTVDTISERKENGGSRPPK